MEAATNIIEFPVDQPIPTPLSTPRFMELWGRWVERRKFHRKPKCGWDRFFKDQLAWLAEYSEPVAFKAVQHSMANDYQGLFPEKFEHLRETVTTAIKESIPLWKQEKLLEDVLTAKKKARPGLPNRCLVDQVEWDEAVAAQKQWAAEYKELEMKLLRLKESQL